MHFLENKDADFGDVEKAELQMVFGLGDSQETSGTKFKRMQNECMKRNQDAF